MLYKADLEEDEEFTYSDIYAPSKSVESFALGVSNRAVYFSEKKRFAIRDPWVLHRFPFSKILSVSLDREKPYIWWALSIIIIIVGSVTSLWMILSWDNPRATRSGIPFGVVAVGIVLPFITTGRQVLRIETVDKTLLWKPPVTVDSASRKRAKTIQKEFIEACIKVRIKTNKTVT